jgi:hypothetical protein
MAYQSGRAPYLPFDFEPKGGRRSEPTTEEEEESTIGEDVEESLDDGQRSSLADGPMEREFGIPSVWLLHI